ncbi:HAMP domain-containing histidine kinase [Patescibacteria group bacterium]|nr:HAMP domain-containing histidine kinase [Candidatus Falkowbacteria bacterium]MBU3905567.1 HAMP domain-containing histidine kinase [Patescibacteria group bacterium]MCG2697650.1 HAMP domain-containing histidine kinase [Candidatus Parcubacteria bacterium]MBU4015680.1 HAMP domain-containing histidine kinase [Patescibacteria group bacterium]MBU4026252.1 HAMP domain-containing histidine kinase [Patescibacteria group bacterium]
MTFKEFFEKHRITFQLVYGVVLIILIPLLIAFNTVFIINKYNKSLDVALQKQALTVGRSIYSLIKDDLADDNKIQESIELLSQKNLEFQDLTVLKPEGDNFKIIASSKKDSVGKILGFYYYHQAWIQPDNDGLATDSLALATTAEGERLIDGFAQEGRFWLVAMPMRGAGGEKQTLLTMKLSSKIIDDLTGETRNVSIYFLVLTVLIVILFLAAAVRLWDYAVLYKKIKEVDQMKDEFISIASHELRTPITGIRGYVSMVIDGTFGQISDKLKETMNIIQSSSDRLAHLVDDLLNVSRIEQDRLKVDLKPLEAGQIIKEVTSELKVQADQKNLKLEYKPHIEKLPLVSIDTERLKQVLINLIGNAIKYTEKGLVEIITEEKNNGKILEIKIKDTGIGMSAKERERLFQKFYRAQNDKTRAVVGTGLGLWITKKIVELMRGKIIVDSMENVGTQITLQFAVVKNKK